MVFQENSPQLVSPQPNARVFHVWLRTDRRGHVTA